MKYKHIDTGGITNFEPLDDSGWYWGMDYTSGDLYEAEELFQDKHIINRNRLVFIHYPDGAIYEPVKAKPGQYLGKPVIYQNEIFCLLVDFKKRMILILKYTTDMRSALIRTQLPLDEVPDCYNLMLDTSPLMLGRQGHENRFQVVWPDKGNFAIDNRECFHSRDADRLIFSKWYEDPDYHEKVIIRRYPTGEIIEQISGTLMMTPDGQKWILE